LQLKRTDISAIDSSLESGKDTRLFAINPVPADAVAAAKSNSAAAILALFLL